MQLQLNMYKIYFFEKLQHNFDICYATLFQNKIKEQWPNLNHIIPYHSITSISQNLCCCDKDANFGFSFGSDLAKPIIFL